MKILHVIHSLDPRSGGPSHALRGLVKQQLASGREVCVLATTAQATKPWVPLVEFQRSMVTDAAFCGARLFMGPVWGRSRLLCRYGYAPACARWLKQQCESKSARPDFVHIHGVYSYLSRISAAIAHRFAIPYALRPAGSLDPTAIGMRSGWGKRLMIWSYLKRQMLNAAFVQAMASPEADHLKRIAPDARIVTVPHGVEIPRLLTDADAQPLVDQYPQLAGKRIVLFIGRLHPIKQPELLVAALAQLRNEFPNLVLLMAGPDGGLLSSLQSAARAAGIAEAVVFPGFLQGPMKRAAFAAADVFALPSRHENFGVAVVEAMAHGVPVLASPHVAASEYVDAAGAGLTVADTVEAIVQGLRSLLSGDLPALSQNGRRFAECNLSWHAAEQQLAELYQVAPDRASSMLTPLSPI